MGNKASSSASKAAARIIWPDGGVRHVETPVAAAEVMMESPGHVVALAEEVARSRRAAGMRADEELRPGDVYLLLPLDKVGCRISDQQMAALLESLGKNNNKKKIKEKKKKKEMGSRRIFPEEKVAVEGEMAVFAGGKRAGGQRQWRPVLDTIHEAS